MRSFVALSIFVVIAVSISTGVPVKENNPGVTFWELAEYEGAEITFTADKLFNCVRLQDFGWARRIVSLNPNTNCAHFYYSEDCTGFGLSYDNTSPYINNLHMNFFGNAAVSFIGFPDKCDPHS